MVFVQMYSWWKRTWGEVEEEVELEELLGRAASLISSIDNVEEIEGIYKIPAAPAARTRFVSAPLLAFPALAAGAIKNGAENSWPRMLVWRFILETFTKEKPFSRIFSQSKRFFL